MNPSLHAHRHIHYRAAHEFGTYKTEKKTSRGSEKRVRFGDKKWTEEWNEEIDLDKE
jgi:hypothetical protein